jgi:pyrimidine deaminase RibD-like protein
MSAIMFHFVSSPEVLTPELETSIANASAWAQVIPTGQTKPSNNVGALVLESFSHIKEDIIKLEERLHAETKAREESDMVLAQNIAKLNNLLAENGILQQENNRIHDANSVLYNCTVCMDRQRTIRLDPCGHMATCASCTEKIMESQGRTCPVCRVPVTRAQRTFLS